MATRLFDPLPPLIHRPYGSRRGLPLKLADNAVVKFQAAVALNVEDEVGARRER